MNSTTRKVGRITVAVGLVALGAGLLMDNLLAAGPSYTSLIIRFWPVLLIGFGAEYLVFSVLDRPDEGRQVRLRFDLGGAFLLLLLVSLTAGFHTLSRWVSLNPRDYVLTSPGSGRTETASVPADGAGAVLIDVDLGRVEVYSQRLSEVRVEADYSLGGVLKLRDQASAMDDFRLNVEGGETIKVTGTAPKGMSVTGLTATYRIYIPTGLKATIETGAGSVMVRDHEGDLKISSKVGAIRVDASAGNLDAEAGSGTINISNYTGSVVAHTSAGGIQLHQVNGPLQLDSGTGLIQVNDYAGGKLVAETKTGSINVSTRAVLEGDVLLRTSAGSISLTVPAESSMKVTAQTKTGSFSGPDFLQVDQSGTSRTAVGSSGGGEHTVTLEATMGSIHFNTQR